MGVTRRLTEAPQKIVAENMGVAIHLVANTQRGLSLDPTTGSSSPAWVWSWRRGATTLSKGAFGSYTSKIIKHKLIRASRRDRLIRVPDPSPGAGRRPGPTPMAAVRPPTGSDGKSPSRSPRSWTVPIGSSGSLWPPRPCPTACCVWSRPAVGAPPWPWWGDLFWGSARRGPAMAREKGVRGVLRERLTKF